MGPDMWFCICNFKFCKKHSKKHSGKCELFKTTATFYPSQLKFVKRRKNVTYREKMANMREEQEKLAADKNEKCYFYSVSICVMDNGGDGEWKGIKARFDRELQWAKIQGEKEYGGCWFLGEWVPYH